jgi:hypothetical protein
MGMLDDAIRDHLELKRRSGAGEDEVDRLEDEAFGPPRREASVIAPPEDQPAASELPPPPGAPAEAATPAPDPEPAREPTPVADHPAPPPEPDSRLEDEPEVPSSTSQPTSEFTVPDARDEQSDYVAPDEEGEDLLEETPDFLQETPEHDRLWFEQKPPKDFDI